MSYFELTKLKELRDYLKASKSVLGINERNLSYTKKYTKGKTRKICDNKLLTKQLLQKNNVGVAKLLQIFETSEDVNNFNFADLKGGFTIKPSLGETGSGILPIFSKSRKTGHYIAYGGKKYTGEELNEFCKDILRNKFSLKSATTKEVVIIEDLIKIHPVFKKISYKGIPDIRLIVFNGIPIMAMLRLSTKESKGKANLHIGGIGIYSY